MTAPRHLLERPWKGISWLILEEAGVDVHEDHVRVPYRNPDGSVYRWRVIADRGRSWWEPGPRRLIPLGVETLNVTDPKRWAVFIAEGESDAFALREAFAGIVNPDTLDGYLAIGCPGAATWRPEWSVYLKPFEVIYSIGDGDIPGRRLNAAVRAAIPWARVVDLEVGDDVRAILQRGGFRALDPYLERADEEARLRAAWALAPDLQTCEALVRGEGVPREAA